MVCRGRLPCARFTSVSGQSGSVYVLPAPVRVGTLLTDSLELGGVVSPTVHDNKSRCHSICRASAACMPLAVDRNMLPGQAHATSLDGAQVVACGTDGYQNMPDGEIEYALVSRGATVLAEFRCVTAAHATARCLLNVHRASTQQLCTILHCLHHCCLCRDVLSNNQAPPDAVSATMRRPGQTAPPVVPVTAM